MRHRTHLKQSIPSQHNATPARRDLGRLGLVTRHVGDFALAVDDLDAALLQLRHRLALHPGARALSLALRTSRAVHATSLTHALLVTPTAARAVLARHLLPGERHAAAGHDLALADGGLVGARLVHLLRRHAAALAGDALRSGRLGVLHSHGRDVGDDGEARRRGLGLVVPAGEGVEARAHLLVRLADVAVWVGVLDVLLLVDLGEALAGLAVVELDHAAAGARGHALGVGPPLDDLVELLGEDAALDELLDALADFGCDDGHGLADVLKVEVLFKEGVHGPVHSLGLARQGPFPLGD
ncbi:hypothetical protein TOPH_06405 [Tolypocladium ophioglossoides CBS 100239]|uniref:Uncharacterized protein n=1 Tax=Tolypocladium ophioglossoides (strain CBS 100239) TaxID=1163406 RepID=A0A0L0N4E3_TOLOC|nr:hypothetical protein TOPH_06405 [Tolypocladium ophioglossoides CBS 100239]